MGETRCDVNSDTFFLRLQPLKAGNANETKSWRGWGGGMEGGGLHGVVLITFILQVHITGGDKQYN